MKHALNASYDHVPASGFIDRILASQRRKMFDAFMSFKRDAANGSVLNVHMKPTPLFGNTDYLQSMSHLRDRARITPYEMVPPKSLQATDVQLPFKDNQFDWVFCNEVIEHAGNADRQALLVKELFRVARRGVFATTANRKHPLEFKTSRPLIHLLPSPVWRRLLKLTGKGKWAANTMLNLVDAPCLYRFAEELPGAPQHDVGHKRVFGIKAHFFLMVRKNATLQTNPK